MSIARHEQPGGTARFDFDGAGGRRLSGRLERARGRRRGAVLFVHCFTCGKGSLPAVRVSRALAARGFDVLRFDFAGLGESEGDFESTTFDSNIEDVEAAARAMGEAGYPVDLLVGHSLGGAAALAAADALPNLKALATIGAPADLKHVLQLLGDQVALIEANGVAEVDLGGARPARIGRPFLDALRTHDLAADIRTLRCPLLVMQAPGDSIVAAENGMALFGLAGGAKSYVSLDGADHLLTDPTHIAYAAEVLSAWSGLALASLPRGAEPQDSAVTVTETEAGGFQVEVATASGLFLADEPEAVGGFGSGPTPVELVAAALGACTTMTMRMYARRKGFDLEAVAVEVAHRLGEGRDRFERRIVLPRGLEPAQRDRLLQIADRCPVHRMLEHGADISTQSDPLSSSARANHAIAARDLVDGSEP